MIKRVLRRILSVEIWRLFPHGANITRYAMYSALEDLLADEAPGAGKKVLAISNSGKLTQILGIENADVTEANYPKHKIIDLKAFSADTFDFVLSDQVLEHFEGNRVGASKDLKGTLSFGLTDRGAGENDPRNHSKHCPRHTTLHHQSGRLPSSANPLCA